MNGRGKESVFERKCKIKIAVGRMRERFREMDAIGLGKGNKRKEGGEIRGRGRVGK